MKDELKTINMELSKMIDKYPNSDMVLKEYSNNTIKGMRILKNLLDYLFKEA